LFVVTRENSTEKKLAAADLVIILLQFFEQLKETQMFEMFVSELENLQKVSE
jgi:hypothetical protein